MFENIKKIHFVGIGGSGMSGIAEALINMGYFVSGSDIVESEITQHLKNLGATIYIGHRKENISNPHVVVATSAVTELNSEIIAANEKNITVIPRAEMLAELMRLKYSICVSGTHGKTTTTSMIGLIFSLVNDPTIVIGGRLKNIQSGIKLGNGKFIIAEADESDGSFLHYTPCISIVTNIDDDHLNYYHSMENIKKTFLKFLNKIPFYGFSVVCGDDKNIADILPDLSRPYKTYGIGKDNDYSAFNIQLFPEKSVYEVKKGELYLGKITINSSGMHNILNSLAACAVALELGIDFSVIKKGLENYKGVGRRLEKIGEYNDILFYDDYAHHPTAIEMSLKSLKEIYPKKRMVVVFQPHRYSRTKELSQKFPKALEVADFVFITGIYSASEEPLEGISGATISSQFSDKTKVKYIEKLPLLIKEVHNFLSKGDICVILGAGNINSIIPEILNEKNN